MISTVAEQLIEVLREAGVRRAELSLTEAPGVLVSIRAASVAASAPARASLR
ncbi:hypothetical protein [Streptomyces noursei]|uniref:hypothetical protein n=1 Tax=Streptomyces noursei TaxID=1971 RepID=UPI0023B7CB27|nr:hypothetical protein [Streptomyces noursei]